MRKIALALFAVAASISCTAEARVLKNSEQLKAALVAAKGGEVIELAPGQYGDFSLKKGQFPTYRSQVTVRPADPSKPPTFVQPVVLHGFNNIVFRNLRWQLSNAAVEKQPLVRLQSGRNISFENNLFQGIRNAQGHFGYGLTAFDIEGLKIADNRFTLLNRAIAAARVRNLRAERNDIVNIGHDGFSLADVTGAIVANLIEDFHPKEGYHPDGIQFHSNGQLAARDVLIQDNFILGSPERRIQGIFMRGSYASDPSQRYRNIRIIGNIVAGSMWHGIAVGQADAVEISGNKVLHLPGKDRMSARLSTLGSTGRVFNNRANQLLLNEEMVQFGNEKIPPASAGDVEILRRQWLARFRNGTKPR